MKRKQCRPEPWPSLHSTQVKREGHVDGYAGPGRAGWKGRLQANAYLQKPAEEQPFGLPICIGGRSVGQVEPALSRLGLAMPAEELRGLIESVRSARASFRQCVSQQLSPQAPLRVAAQPSSAVSNSRKKKGKRLRSGQLEVAAVSRKSKKPRAIKLKPQRDMLRCV